MRCLALLFALVATVSAQETMIHVVSDTKTSTQVDVVASFTKAAPRGYLPVRVTMANHQTNAKTVNLSFESSSGYGDNGSHMRSSFSLSSPPEKTTEQYLLVPLVTLTGNYSNGSRVTCDMSGGFGSSNGGVSCEFTGDQPAVLLSEQLHTPNVGNLDTENASHYGGYRGSSDFAGKFDPKQMPEDWRAYSGYDAILMTDADWTSMLPGVRSSIIGWVRLGGQLVIYTESATLGSLGLPEDASGGRIVLERHTGNALDAKKTVNLVSGSGRGMPPQQKALREDFSSTWPLQQTFGKRGFNYAVFIIILIAFGVVVGPVNLFVFAKSGRRHRLFITTPLISLAASLILVALILIQDGFGGRGSRIVLMEVRPDNSENSAYIHQEQFSRTGVLTGARFTLTESASLAPVPIDGDNRWARLTTSSTGGGAYNADFKDGKLETSGDWFQSRSEQGHILDAVIPTRGRIERTTASGNPQLLSTFDFPLETIFYLDSSKQWWRADKVQPGTKFQPTPVAEAIVKPILNDEGRKFGGRNRASFERLRNRPSAFIALTTAAPGVDTYKGIKWQETYTVVTGPVVAP